jgi:hypothetical protein
MAKRIRTINHHVVRPIPNVGGGEIDKRPIRGYDVCPELYANIFITSRKKSGKTTIIWHLLKSCATRDTTVIIFASTVNKDSGWLNIKKLLKKNKIPCLTYDSLKDEDVDRLQVLVKQLTSEADEREKENESDSEDDEEDERGPIGEFKNSDDEGDSDDEPKKRRNKYQSPEYIIVYDDLSGELKSNSITELLKKNRHFLLKNIISSQYPLDLPPMSRAQIDLWIMLKGQADDKLEKIFTSLQCRIDFPTFLNYYNTATKDTEKNDHNFFFFMPHMDQYRRNFNQVIE